MDMYFSDLICATPFRSTETLSDISCLIMCYRWVEQKFSIVVWECIFLYFSNNFLKKLCTLPMKVSVNLLSFYDNKLCCILVADRLGCTWNLASWFHKYNFLIYCRKHTFLMPPEIQDLEVTADLFPSLYLYLTIY